MARVGKLKQYAAFNRLPNCFGRHQQSAASISAWRDRNRPLALEIGAGRAEIAVFLATTRPDWQVIAIDKKSDRLFKAARNSNLYNLVFLQTDIDDLSDHIDIDAQVDLIWLAFPDPFQRRRQAKARLTHQSRLKVYSRLLKDDGRLRLKTDDQGLFRYSLDNLRDGRWTIADQSQALTASADDSAVLTTYERQFRAAGRSIGFIEAVPPRD